MAVDLCPIGAGSHATKNNLEHDRRILCKDCPECQIMGIKDIISIQDLIWEIKNHLGFLGASNIGIEFPHSFTPQEILFPIKSNRPKEPYDLYLDGRLEIICSIFSVVEAFEKQIKLTEDIVNATNQ